MNWIAVAILAYAALGLQTGLGAFIRWGAAQPSFALLAMVFIAINARPRLALLACFAIGALQDLATQRPLGLFAFSFGLAAFFVARAARSVNREHPLTHLWCALIAGAITALAIFARARLHGVGTPLSDAFSGVLYTALLAPVLIGALQRIKPLFAFRK